MADPPDLLLEVTPPVAADTNGNATMTFNQPEAGWSWLGTIVLASYPDPSVVVPGTAAWIVLIGPAFWGQYFGGAGAQAQVRGAQTVTVAAKGLTPGQQYQAVWNGGKVPLVGAPFLAPFPSRVGG